MFGNASASIRRFIQGDLSTPISASGVQIAVLSLLHPPADDLVEVQRAPAVRVGLRCVARRRPVRRAAMPKAAGASAEQIRLAKGVKHHI